MGSTPWISRNVKRATLPEVVIEVLSIVLFWTHRDVVVLWRDAVAFLWKKLGSSRQNGRIAHLIRQLPMDCCQVKALGDLFIAEAILLQGRW